MKKEEDKNRVCPVEQAGALDTCYRRWMQSPKRILKPFINKGMHVLDLGCGPGVYTLEIARMAGEKGKVIAASNRVPACGGQVKLIYPAIHSQKTNRSDTN